MCGKRGITFISHSKTIDASKHLNEKMLHVNYVLKMFTEIFLVFLKQFN